MMKRKQALTLLGLSSNASIDQINLSYKGLTVQFYNDKNKNTLEAQEKFAKITRAYLWLRERESPSKKEESTTTLKEMNNDLNLANKMSCPLPDKDEVELIASIWNINNLSLEQNKDLDTPSYNNMQKMEASPQLAQQVMVEEEKEKKKADKKKAYKKRRKERKKLEKDNGTSSSKENDELDRNDSSSDNEEVLDPNSAFVVHAAKLQTNQKKNNLDFKKISKEKNEDQLENPMSKSLQLAIEGNRKATDGEYYEAIRLFTEAIRINNDDPRLFGNRSYCYDRLKLYEKALDDAEKGISLQIDAPKGYYRKGRALIGLKKYVQAEKAFMEVIKLEKECKEAIQELTTVRALQLMEMGFSKSQADQAIKQYGTVQAALDSLLSSSTESFEGSETYSSEEEEEEEADNNEDDDDDVETSQNDSTPPKSPTFLSAYNINSKNDQVASMNKKMDPKSPEGSNSLWVGNVTAEISEKDLLKLFTKHGEVLSVRIIPGSFCAFVNFNNKASASRAMEALQGKDLGGKNLKIKFPDNPTSTINSKSKGLGPVHTSQGAECRFFRLSNCVHGTNCFYKHIKEHKGIDLKK